jgi:hypothetical protein
MPVIASVIATLLSRASLKRRACCCVACPICCCLRDPDQPDVAHLRLLAAQKRVTVVVDPHMPIQATALIRDLS